LDRHPLVAGGNGGTIFTWQLSGSIGSGEALVAGDATTTPPIPGPNITYLRTDPLWPLAGQEVDALADVTDTLSVTTVTLLWGTTASSLTNEIAMSVWSGSTYRTASPVPGQPAGTTIYHKVRAINSAPATSTSSLESYAVPYELTIYEIQGQVASSPYDGAAAITRGVVLLALPSAGYVRRRGGIFLDRGRVRWLSSPIMRRRDVLVVAVVPFAATFALYLSTLAPTVTFEDSGELITAAYGLGVPHPPGYPVFCIVGKVFSLLPVGNVAWRLNLMSAFFMAASTAALSLAAFLMLAQLGGRGRTVGSGAAGLGGAAGPRNSVCGRRAPWPCIHGAAVGAGMMLGTAFEVWEQAVITEVYALNAFIIALDLLLLALWERAEPARKHRYFYGLCFALGLGLLIHPTALIMLPVALLYLALVGGRYVLSGRRLALGLVYFALGLSPVLYLPLASRGEPISDFGDPENLRNFLLVVLRRLSYRDTYSWAKSVAQIGHGFTLLVRQWFPVLLIPVGIGLAELFRQSRKHFWVVAALLVASGPVMSVVTNYDVSTVSPDLIEVNKWNVSVFYIPCYLGLSLAAAFGLLYLGSHLARLVRDARVAALVLAALPAAFVPLTYGRVDMSDYRFAANYAEAVFRVTGKNGLVISEHDPEFFPLLYYQAVEGKRTDLVMVNRMLLQRSWYVQVLKDHHPDLLSASAPEARAFLGAIEPFESGRPYDGGYIQGTYDALINSFIDKTLGAGRPVYLTFMPTDAIARRYQKESLGVILSVRPTLEPLTPLDPEGLGIDALAVDRARLDFPTRYMRDHFQSYLRLRAGQLDAAGETAQARRFYLMAQSLGS
jgi:hypothetical protein